jgi:hypothetical protein
MPAATTKAEAIAVVKKIMAAPTSAAFDTVCGSIVRLFSHYLALSRRMDRLAAELEACRQRLRAVEVAPIDAAQRSEVKVAATTVRGHPGHHKWRQPAPARSCEEETPLTPAAE